MYSISIAIKYVQAKYQIIQNKKDNAINILDSVEKSNGLYHLAQFESIYLEIIEGNYDKALNKIIKVEKNPDSNNYIEEIIVLQGEIYDYILNEQSNAVDVYLGYLDRFPNSIYYDMIRKRLRKIAL